jgi:hypothetical protein
MEVPRNEYIDAGIGTSVPLADLDLDGKPDLCLGGVFSLFRNVLSVGVGYDFDIDVPYTFFGISIPVLNLFTFPGSKDTSSL